MLVTLLAHQVRDAGLRPAVVVLVLHVRPAAAAAAAAVSEEQRRHPGQASVRSAPRQASVRSAPRQASVLAGLAEVLEGRVLRLLGSFVAAVH